jgi:transcription elongation factor GreA
MAERVELTAEGKTTLEAELRQLLEVDEPETLAQMAAAAAQGDLRENFAYHDARRELGMIRGRIAHLRQTLTNSTVIEAPAKDGQIRLGSVVVVKEEGMDDEEEYTLVSAAETGKTRSDGKTALSISAPMGAALLGKKAGDKAVVTTPTGMKLSFIVVRVN